jgi:flagellar basal-body rod protein FlgG
MIRALSSAASGMFAEQLNLDNIANNLANVNTTGFKKGQIQFQDLMYELVSPPAGSIQNTQIEPVALEVGSGVEPVAITRCFEQGTNTQTNNPLDVAISGEGFLQVTLPDGSMAYTRDGALKVSPEGVIVTSNGNPLEPSVQIPPDTQQVQISADGVISALAIGQTLPQEIGQIELARFVNPAGLSGLGKDLYAETAASGQPQHGSAGKDGFGQIEQGFLESSNVSVVEEMVAMITAQRAYEINSKTIRTAEDMLSQAVNLKR